ncbi:MAG TPA: pentapeptide repeat-containing protein, partial [Acidimicrobiales bacterium]
MVAHPLSALAVPYSGCGAPIVQNPTADHKTICVRGAQLGKVEWSHLNLSYAHLIEVNLSQANLASANLSHAALVLSD